MLKFQVLKVSQHLYIFFYSLAFSPSLKMIQPTTSLCVMMWEEVVTIFAKWEYFQISKTFHFEHINPQKTIRKYMTHKWNEASLAIAN